MSADGCPFIKLMLMLMPILFKKKIGREKAHSKRAREK
jgi:hypothetical protein